MAARDAVAAMKTTLKPSDEEQRTEHHPAAAALLEGDVGRGR